jgi:HK97 gp10 family phage protein
VKEFKSFGSFAAHLTKLAATGHEVTHHMVKAGAEEIEKTAQGEIGFYQTDIAPYPDWALLADSTEAEKARLGFEPDAPLLRTGEMKKSIHASVEGNEAVVGSNDGILKYHEFGTDRMPPRPVLGPAAHHSSPRIMSQFAKTTFAWLAGMGWKRTQFLRK